jgi:hypothetical protein
VLSRTAHKELSKPLLAAVVILFAFVSGISMSVGIRSLLMAKSEYFWLFEIAMALFLLVSATSYARKLMDSLGQTIHNK